MVEDEEATAVRKQRLDLDAGHELGHPIQDVRGPSAAYRLDRAVRQPVARGLAQLVADEGHGLRLAQLQPRRARRASSAAKRSMLSSGQQPHRDRL